MEKAQTLKLYKAVWGVHDKSIANGLYEFHQHYYITAESLKEALDKICKTNPDIKKKGMHFDGIEEINCVDGHEIQLSAAAPIAEGKHVYLGKEYFNGKKELPKEAMVKPILKFFVVHCGFCDPTFL